MRIYDALVDKGAKSLEGYTHIRAYHACRTSSVNSYSERGILALGYDEMLALCIERLSPLGKTELDIQGAFDKIWEVYEKAKHRSVYLGIWKDELLDKSGHYLVYGSELITSVACELAKSQYEANSNQALLTKIGRPTLIVCDIPIKDIDEFWLESINRCMPIQSDASFSVEYVASESIVGFEYPTRMFDPLRNRWYTFGESRSWTDGINAVRIWEEQ